MTITTALLMFTVMLSSSTIPLGQVLKYDRVEPMPSKASRAALIVDTSKAERTIVVLPPQANCDRLDQWAEQVSDLLIQTGRTGTRLIVTEEDSLRWLAPRKNSRLATELRRRIHQNLAAEAAANHPAATAGT